MHECLISLLLCGMYKILRAIVLLFDSNFFLSFVCDEKVISLLSY